MSDDERLLFGPEFQAQLAQMQAATGVTAEPLPLPPTLSEQILQFAEDVAQRVAPPSQEPEPTLGDIIANEIRLASGPDSDRDGRTDLREAEEGTHPQRDQRDVDMDGLDNAAEAAHGTSPYLYDTDYDGMADGFEVAAGRNPMFPEGEPQPGFYEQVLASRFDADSDGLLDAVEAQLGTDPASANTDRDRFSDADEVGSWGEAMRLDPLSPDSDGDGRIDGFDSDSSRDEADDDFDGLDNTLEHTLGTSTDHYDTDGDGATDGLEVARDTNPIVFDEVGDEDLDAAAALESVQRFDRDLDGLVDQVERKRSTNPDDADTDDDGLPDGIDDAPLGMIEGIEPDLAPSRADFDQPGSEPSSDAFTDEIEAVSAAFDGVNDVFDGL